MSEAVELFPDRPMSGNEMTRIHKKIDGISTWRLEVDSCVTRVYEVEATSEQEAWDLYSDDKAREVFDDTNSLWPEEKAWRAREIL